MPEMKALTVRQPWAWAIVVGYKGIENRSWPTRHRGRLAIHAAQRHDPEGDRVFAELGIDVPANLPYGCVIGIVEMVGCVPVDHPQTWFDAAPIAADPFATGPWCWILENPQPLAEPVPCRGQRMLWTWEA
jgi:hypothetical protein